MQGRRTHAGLERISCMYALHQKRKAAKVDISNLPLFFKLSQMPSCTVYVRLPLDLPSEAAELGYVPGGVYLQKKAIYGRIDAPNIFTTGIMKKLEIEG